MPCTHSAATASGHPPAKVFSVNSASELRALCGQSDCLRLRAPMSSLVDRSCRVPCVEEVVGALAERFPEELVVNFDHLGVFV